jgi:hypothetical protein
MTFDGLGNGKHHFLKVWIQEIRLFLETTYLHNRDWDAVGVKPMLAGVQTLTVASMRCSRSDSDLESSSDGSWFKSTERRRWRFSRNHSRLSNFVGVARSATLPSSRVSIIRRL